MKRDRSPFDLRCRPPRQAIRIRRTRVGALALAMAGGLAIVAGSPAYATTILEACGPRGASTGNGQLDQACRAAYATGDASFINDNNSRVWAPVAIVCGYTCILGSSTRVCSNQQTAGNAAAVGAGTGSSSDPCSTAVTSGTNSYNASKQSDSDFQSAAFNGGDALALRSNMATLAGAGTPTGGSAASGMPSICAQAIKSGAAQDRIACAAATDPRLPSFVSDPRFAQEFQGITGQRLDDVINQDAASLAGQAPSALANAANGLQGKVSFSQFIAAGGKLVKGVLDSLGSDKDRARFIANVIPGNFKGAFSSSGSGAGGGAATALAKAADAGGESAVPTGAADGYLTAASRGPADDGSLGDGRDVSLFVRVSARYRQTSDRLARLNWVLPVNR